MKIILLIWACVSPAQLEDTWAQCLKNYDSCSTDSRCYDKLKECSEWVKFELDCAEDLTPKLSLR